MSLQQPVRMPVSLRGLIRERMQLGVVVIVLAMAVGWIVMYSTVVNGATVTVRISSELARKLSSEHAAEMTVIQAQTFEVYGGNPPPQPAGS